MIKELFEAVYKTREKVEACGGMEDGELCRYCRIELASALVDLLTTQGVSLYYKHVMISCTQDIKEIKAILEHEQQAKEQEDEDRQQRMRDLLNEKLEKTSLRVIK